MHPSKTPGPDGVSPLFLQKCWNIVKCDIVNLVQQAFQTGSIQPSINKSLITLIPKVKGADNLSKFRPISLSNVVLKIINKTLANRLKPWMDYLIPNTQSSFIKERHTTDNIILTQTVVHTLKSKKGNKGAFIAKIGFEKAFDRVDWTF